jgi:sugar phosphate isomerase/epimerase
MTSPRPWPLAARLPAAPAEFVAAVARAAALGFTHVEVTALAERPAEHLEALADAGVLVAAAALGADDVRALRDQVADAARLGATCASLPAEVCSAEGRALLADYAAGRMVRLCVRPAPGGARAWLDNCGPGTLRFLLDVEACRAAGEDPAAVARRAGARLGHVHVGAAGDLGGLAEALREVGYRGAVGVPLAG